MAYNNGGSANWKNQFQKLNLMTALGMMAFLAFSLTFMGLTGELVSLMEQHPWLPLTGSLAALVLIFMSSGTRDPSYYSTAEVVTVAGGLVAMSAYSYLDEFSQFVDGYDPWGRVVLLAFLVIVSAILAR